jgi:hypothetical protein
VRPKHDRVGLIISVALILIPALGLIVVDAYHARELIFTELFFALVFGGLILLVGACYVLGWAGARGWSFAKLELRKKIHHPQGTLRAATPSSDVQGRAHAHRNRNVA